MQFIKKNLTLLLLILVIVFQMGFYGLFYYQFFYKNDNVIEQKSIEVLNAKNEQNEEEKVFVDIKGAVNKSGVYEVSKNTIINDVIKIAGGFKKDAYQNNINLSKKVTNEMVIYIYTKSEYQKLNEPKIKEVIIEKECECPSYNVDNCVKDGSSIITYNPEAKVEIKNDENPENPENNLININTAQIDELKKLSGIGDAKAKSIIEYRQKNGNFTKKEDLILVSGISEKLYEDIKEHICI